MLNSYSNFSIIFLLLALMPLSYSQEEPLFDYWLDSPVGLESYQRRGLETTNFRNVRIVVEVLSEDALELGLTEQRVRNRVELRFLESNIRPNDDQADLDANHPSFYVNVLVSDGVFNVYTSYNRPLFFDANRNAYVTVGTTWSKFTIGKYETKQDTAPQILETLDNLLEQFLVAYLTANID